MKVIIYVKDGDLDISWENCMPVTKHEISDILNAQGLRILGYVPKKII